MQTIKTVLILDDGRLGHLNQCIGVAEALNASYTCVSLPKYNFFQKLVKPSLCFLEKTFSQQDIPDVVIGAGWRTTHILSQIKKKYPFVKTVKIMSPMTRLGMKISPKNWHKKGLDVVAVPAHEVTGVLPNFAVKIVGAPNRVNQKNLEEAHKTWAPIFSKSGKKKVAVLVGGSAKSFVFDEKKAKEFADRLSQFAEENDFGLLITTSRRTGARQASILKQRFEGSDVFFWDGKGKNPIFGYFSEADAFVVTAESTSMISEACSTGKPVYLYGVDKHMHLEGMGKFNRFYKVLEKEGRVKVFGDSFEKMPIKPLNDALLVAEKIIL